ncbi:MAG: ArsR family transcriptional regulator [Chloroflexota bacterium]
MTKKTTIRDFEPSLSPMQETLTDVQNTMHKYFEIVDWQGVQIVLGVTVAHYIKGVMLWFRFLGASRSGKTQILDAITLGKTDKDDITELEVATPAAFRGGLEKGHLILKRIDGKLVITKDIASLLTFKKEMRTELFGVLRGVKDGHLTSDFGSNQGYLPQKAKFDWIIAATSSSIEQGRQLDEQLGQRFIDLRWVLGTREEMAYRALKNSPEMEKIGEELSVVVNTLILRAKESLKDSEPDLSERDARWISAISDTTAILRAGISRNTKGIIMSHPEPEAPTEIAQGLSRIAKGLICLDVLDWKQHIARIARDTIPETRLKILQSLDGNPQTVDELIESVGLPKRTIYYYLEELELLKAVKKGRSDTYEISIKLP